jgi:thiamine-monophosphate kinase
MTRLYEIGERRLIDTVFADRYKHGGQRFGDDCVFLMDTPQGALVASTDPASQPVAWDLGFRDYYHWGWLLAASNLSDLAAAGAEPVGLLSSLILPNDLELADLQRFLDGLDDCCKQYNCQVLGGNIKEGGSFRCDATVIGKTVGGKPLSRRGACVGDIIAAIGSSGYFWSAVLSYKRDLKLTSSEHESLFTALVKPKPQLTIGMSLRSQSMVKASTDASDGLYSAIENLSVSQGLGFRIDLSGLEYPEIVRKVAELSDVQPFRLILGFGDLQLVCAFPQDQLANVRAEVAAADETLMVLGQITDTGLLEVVTDRGLAILGNFDNERLTRESSFTAGLAAYENRLFSAPLTEPGKEPSV